jgi:hypothetical protein
MQVPQVKTHQDGIWISSTKEVDIVKQCNQAILENNFYVVRQDSNNYGYPYVYNRDGQILDCRFIDSVFFEHPESWTESSAIITDNIPLQPVTGKLVSVVPEFWSIWRFNPVYLDRPAVWAYNCFMNRPRGDRSMAFYELVRRNILDKGIVSYNVTMTEYNQQFIQSDLVEYRTEHDLAKNMIPYNNLTESLEQCIVDSRVSLILETYTSDSHVVFSEKIFRALQLPRPWLLYCSPGSIKYLRDYGFDVLGEYVDHGYDNIIQHGHRLLNILDQLETFQTRQYQAHDYTRFQLAAKHNRTLLKKFEQQWPAKFDSILNEIRKL